MSETAVEIPLFPLRTVLFPGGVLPLRIFEPRYVDMVRHCMRTESDFGVILLRAGEEVHDAAQPTQAQVFEIGTLARIVDFNQADHGMLGIVVRGGQKFRVGATRIQKDQLMMGQVECLPAEPVGELLAEHDHLVEILRQLSQHPLVQQLKLEIDYTQASSVSLRLAELLPIEPEIKQALLQLGWPRERLAELSRIVKKFQES